MLRQLALLPALFVVTPCQAQAFDRLPADSGTIILMGDMLPMLRQVTESPEAGAVLDAVGPVLTEQFGISVDAGRAKGALALAGDFVPMEMAIGCPSSTTDSFFRVAQLQVATKLLPLLQDDGEEAELRESLLEHLRSSVQGAHRFDGVMSVKMRSERGAEQAFESVVEGLGAFAGRMNATVEHGDDSVSVTWDLGQMLIRAYGAELRQHEVEVPEAFGCVVTLRIGLDGDTLELRLGEPAAGPYDPAALGESWSAEPRPLVFQSVRGDVTAEFEALYGLVEASMFAAHDDAFDVAFEMMERLDKVEPVVADWTTAIRFDRGLQLLAEEPADALDFELFLPAPTLAPLSGVSEGPSVLLAMSLDVLLWSIGLDGAGLLGLDFTEEEFLPATAEFLGGEDSALFDEGVAIVSRPGVFRGCKGLGLEAMPWGVGALVARAENDAAAASFMDALGDCLAEDLGLKNHPWKLQDLGLGYETQLVDCAAFPGWAELGMDCDFAPHWLVVDGHLIVSTDVKLSRMIAGRLTGPQPDRGSNHVLWRGGCDGAMLQSLAHGARLWIEKLVPEQMADESIARMLDALVLLGGRLASVDVACELDEQKMLARTRFDLRLR